MSKSVYYYKPLPKDDAEIEIALQEKAVQHSEEGFWKAYSHLRNTTTHRIKKELSICQSLLCLDLVSFPVLSQIKPQAPLLVVPFRQFL